MKYLIALLQFCAIILYVNSVEICKVTAKCRIGGKDKSQCKRIPAGFADWDASMSGGGESGGSTSPGNRYCAKAYGWTSGNNGYQYKIISELASWEMAQTLCQYEGATLPVGSFSSTAYGGFESFLRQNGHIYGFWLPMTDKAQEGQWRWIGSNAPVTTTRWNGGQPDGSGDCAYINRDWGYNWDDGECTATFAVVCERPA